MPETKSVPVNMASIGQTGLTRWYGLIDEEWQRELKGSKAITVYKEMRDNEPVIASSLFVISMFIRGLNWEVTEEEGVSSEAMEFLEQCMEDMEQTWDDFIDEILSMLPFGWSYHEILYKLRRGDHPDPTYRSKYNDGKIGWRGFPIRAQETFWRWEFDENGYLLGMWQKPDWETNPVFIPINKALHFRTSKHKNNPEGRSLLRSAYRPWYFKKNIEVIEGIGIERDLAGLPVLAVPPEILMDNAAPELIALRDRLKKMMLHIRRDEKEGLLIPNKEAGYEFQLLSSGGARQFDITSVVERKAREIMMTMLSDFILLGHEQVGTYNLSTSKVGLFTTALNGWIETIEQTINEQAVAPLMKINNFDAVPRIKAGKVNVRDVTEKIEAVSKMSNSGMMPNPVPMNIVNEMLQDLDLPQLTDEDYNRITPPSAPGGGMFGL